MDKVEMLNAVLADPARSEHDKEVARIALKQIQLASQPQQDSQLELWFSCRNTHDRIEARKNFGPETTQLVDDYGDYILGFPHSYASARATRLMTLYDRTASSVVREKYLPVLQSIALYAPEPSVRYRVQDYLVERGLNQLQDFFPLNNFIATLQRAVDNRDPDPQGIIAERLKSALTTRKLPPDMQQRYGRGEMER